MKTLHLEIVLFSIIVFLGFGLESAQSDKSNDVYIQDIQVQPSTVKVGESFAISATLVNNSTFPIFVDGGKCSSQDTQAELFTITLDNHVKNKPENINCAGVGWSPLLDPGKSISGTNDYTTNYVATESGTATITVTFSYHSLVQKDPFQTSAEQTISKSFQFQIRDVNSDSTVPPITMLKITPPLQQFKSGILPKDVQCRPNLTLVFKVDGSPACVTPAHVPLLYLRGWLLSPFNGEIVFVIKPDTSGQILVRYLNPTSDIDVQLNNRLYDGSTGKEIHTTQLKVDSTPNIISHNSTVTATYSITAQNATGIYWLQVASCEFIPIVVEKDTGQIRFSDLQNMMMAEWKCPGPIVHYRVIGTNNIQVAYINAKTSVHDIGISSNQTQPNKIEIGLSNQTYEAGYPVTVNLKNINQNSTCEIPSVSVVDASDQSLVFGPTPVRTYPGHCVDPWPVTFYAGLEKNQLVTKPTDYSIIATLDNKTYQKNIVVIPSQYSTTNLTADTPIMPGFLTFSHCLPIPNAPPNNGTLVSYSGFDLYKRYLAGPDTNGFPEIDDYLLRPGHTGSFVMQVHQGQFPVGANLSGGLAFLSGNLLGINNSTVWTGNRPLASDAHPGLEVTYTPSFALAGPQGYATITASVSAQQDAPKGTYWVNLPPGVCSGKRVLLTVGDKPLSQPPDLIGYDFASNFAHNENEANFEIINAGIHTFENCSLDYTYKNQTHSIMNFDVIAPGMQFQYHGNTTTPIDSGSFECKKPLLHKLYSDVWVSTIPY